MAGASGMRWRTFLTYNVSGALVWAGSVAGVASLVGPAGAAMLSTAALVTAAAAALVLAVRASRRRRRVGGSEPVGVLAS